MKKLLASAAFVAMVAAAGMAYADSYTFTSITTVSGQTIADARIHVNGTVPSVCSWSGNSNHKEVAWHLDGLTNDYGYVQPAAHRLPLGTAVCNGAVKVSFHTDNGGLKMPNGDCRDVSSTKSCILYNAKVQLDGGDPEIDYTTDGSAHEETSGLVPNGNAPVALILTPQVPNNDPQMKPGDYADTITVKVGSLI